MSTERIALMLSRAVPAKAEPAAAKGATASQKPIPQIVAPKDTAAINGYPKEFVINLIKALNTLEDEKSMNAILGIISAAGFSAGAVYLMAIVSCAIVASPIVTTMIAIATAITMFYGVGFGVQYTGSDTKAKICFDKIVAAMKTLTPSQNAQILSEIRRTDPALASQILTALQK